MSPPCGHFMIGRSRESMAADVSAGFCPACPDRLERFPSPGDDSEVRQCPCCGTTWTVRFTRKVGAT